MKKAVLFDFHNTLATCDAWLELEIKTLPSLAIQQLVTAGALDRSALQRLALAEVEFKALRQAVRTSGVELSAVEGTTRVLHKLGFDLPVEDVSPVVRRLEEALLPQVEMVEGADRALQALQSLGLPLGVVSSAGYPLFVEMALEMLGLRPFFNVVVTSAGEGIYKSDPEIFRRAASYLGEQPSGAVHVGDHPVYDVQTAKAAGLSAIWFSANSGRTATIHELTSQDMTRYAKDADAVIESMDDLLNAISAL